MTGSGSGNDEPDTPDNVPTAAAGTAAKADDPAVLGALQRLLQPNDDEDSETRRALIQQIQTVAYQGPIPPPQMLADYDNMVPGLADRIVRKWEEQQDHRRKLERAVVERDEGRMDRSQKYALVVALAGLGMAAVLGLAGASPWIAGVVAVVAVGGTSSAVLIGQSLANNRDKP